MRRATGRMLTTVERLEMAQCLLVRQLPCGCEVGLYQTLSGRLLTVVDNPDDDCADRGHQADVVIAVEDADRGAATPSHGEAA
jgi:hypothetical protein